jgi:hypothetical protein
MPNYQSSETDSKFRPGTCRREGRVLPPKMWVRTMVSWLVPPIVIPVFLAIFIAGYAFYRAFTLRARTDEHGLRFFASNFRVQ